MEARKMVAAEQAMTALGELCTSTARWGPGSSAKQWMVAKLAKVQKQEPAAL